MATLDHIPLEAKPVTSADTSQDTTSTIQPRNTGEMTEQGHPLRSKTTLPAWQFKGLVSMIALTALLLGYDIGNVSNIQAPIYEAMGRIELLPWVGMAMVTGGASVVPIYRQLAGILDFRHILRAGLVLFAAGSALTGSATNIEGIIVGRVLIGMGLTGVYQIVLSYVAVYASAESAPKVMGLVGGQWALGLLCGPIIGAAFAENIHTTWRWSMYINLPFICVLFAGTFFLFPSYSVPYDGSVWSYLITVDWLGCVLHVGTLVLMNMALTFSGSVWAWNSAPTITLWVIAALVFLAYILQQKFSILTTPARRASYGRLLAMRVVGLAAFGTLTSSFCYALTMYYLPLFFAFARGHDAIGTAVHCLPFLCVFITSSILSGALLPRVKRYAVFYMLSGACLLTGAALMTTVTPDTSEARVMGFESLLGLGMGLVWFNGMSISNAILPPPERFDAAALFNLTQFGATGLGLGLAGCLYQNLGFNALKDSIGSYGFTDDAIREALSGVASPILASGNPRLLHQVILAVTSTMAKLFYFATASGSTLFLASFLMKWHKLEFRKPVDAKV